MRNMGNYLAKEGVCICVYNKTDYKFKFKIGPVVQKIPKFRKRAVLMLLLTVDQKCTLHIQPVDDKGNPAKVDGIPAWGISDTTILSITASDDGLTAVVDTLGPLGVSQVNVSVDADLGEGVTTISGVLDITVVAGQAVSLNIGADAPEQK